MPYYPKEVIEKAKEMDLLTYLQNYEPDELVHFSGDTYCTKEHDSLKISNGLWCWNSRGIGGKSAVKYLTDVKGYSFIDAVKIIVEKEKLQPPVKAIAPKKKRVYNLKLPPKMNKINLSTQRFVQRRTKELWANVREVISHIPLN